MRKFWLTAIGKTIFHPGMEEKGEVFLCLCSSSVSVAKSFENMQSLEGLCSSKASSKSPGKPLWTEKGAPLSRFSESMSVNCTVVCYLYLGQWAWVSQKLKIKKLFSWLTPKDL